MLHSIACIAIPHMAPFEFGVICEVFGIDRTEHGGPTFDFHVVAAEPGVIELPGEEALALFGRLPSG